MSRDSKTAEAILLLVDELRLQRVARERLESEFGRLCDTVGELTTSVESAHASHQKNNREYAGLEARVTKLERSSDAAE